MSIYTVKKDTPYIVDDTVAQLLLDSRPEPQSQQIVTDCAKLFETMNIRTAEEKEEKDADT